MEIHQLVYFVAIVETGGFSRAAERCNVAQPSLSQQIMKLEQELGQPLFYRLGRKVALTDAGRALLPRANAILSELHDIKHGMAQEVDTGRGTLSVGFIPTIAQFILPRLVRRFQQTFPQAFLTVHEDFTENLVADLVDGKLDVSIVSLPIHNRLVETRELLTEPLLVAFPRRYEQASRTSILVKELAEFPFIALSEVHCLGEQVQDFCYQQQVDLQIVCHTAQLSTVQSCVALGLGVSLVPQALALSDPSEEIIYRPVGDVVPRRKIAAATRAGRKPSLLAREFIRMVQEEYPCYT